MDQSAIFDRRRRRLRRDRAARDFVRHAFLIDAMTEELLFRLDGITRPFARALVLGCHDGRIGTALRARGIATVVSADPGFRFASAAGGVQCDEDRLPFADDSFDLVVSVGLFDTVNDLPGALILLRRALRPDGVLLAAFVGAGSLPALGRAVLSADAARDRGVPPRLHPRIDVRAAGDLLVRAGFALPVADMISLEIGYRGLPQLIADLRGMAQTNLLNGPVVPIDRPGLLRLAEGFAENADASGRIGETVSIVILTGWAPAPDQPRPARRGSASRSLAAVLDPKARPRSIP